MSNRYQGYDKWIKMALVNPDYILIKDILLEYPALLSSFVPKELPFEFYIDLLSTNLKFFKYINDDIPRYNELEELYGFLTL